MQLSSQPKGLLHVISIQMWEFFSYYGMRSLLILYLTQKLLMADEHAYGLYGAYTSLVYVTPIIGGYLADKYLGNYWSVVIGALLMVGGHFVLSIPSPDNSNMYIALSLIICGYGFFKTNSNCLIGELYANEHEGSRESGFSISYVGGNIGAAISPILCGYAAFRWGWHVGFALAGVGMLLGLLIFGFGYRNFAKTKGVNKKELSKKSAGIPHWLIILLLLIVSVIALNLVLQHLLAGYILSIICVISMYQILTLYRGSTRDDKAKLNSIIYFMLFGTIFWAFDQQGGSSISLFIERNVDTELLGFTIPTAFFQSINATAVIIGGVAVAWLWKILAGKQINVRTLAKLNIGLLLLTGGFTLITLSAKLAMSTGSTNFVWLCLGLFLIGIAELFIDPVAFSAITKLNPKGKTSTLAAIYAMMSGSVANYLAASIASFASATSPITAANDKIASATQYHQVFQTIMLISLGALVLGLLVNMITRKKDL